MSATLTAGMTKSAFLAAAKPVPVAFSDTAWGALMGERRRFSTGTMGYYANGKVTLPLGDKVQTYQVQVSLFAVKSKEWTDEQRAAFLATAPEGYSVSFDKLSPIVTEVKQFSTGTVGHYGNGKVTLKGAGGEPQTYQVQVSLFAVKSKEWPAA
jgi:hypothetical protein